MAPVHNERDPMDPDTYRTIIIGHMLAKLYGAVMEAKLNDYMETFKLLAWCLIDLTKANNKKLYSCFVDFPKSFDMVPGVW